MDQGAGQADTLPVPFRQRSDHLSADVVQHASIDHICQVSGQITPAGLLRCRRGNAGTPPLGAPGRGGHSLGDIRSSGAQPRSRGRTSSPPTAIRPLVAGRNAVIIRMVVLLPAPFGPRKPSTCPSGTKNEMSSTTGVWTKTLLSRSTSIIEDHLLPLPPASAGADLGSVDGLCGKQDSCLRRARWAKADGRRGCNDGASHPPRGHLGTCQVGSFRSLDRGPSAMRAARHLAATEMSVMRRWRRRVRSRPPRLE